jgi:hypothetical protein
VDAPSVIAAIRRGFARTTRPADPFLVGSREGCEPEATVSVFFGKMEWDGLDPRVLDQHYDALSFFSEAGFRFFLPAYLIADVEGHLLTADPVLHLASNFRDDVVDLPAGAQVFRKRLGLLALLNPQRYGAMTFGDYARCRFSVFTREEAQAIVTYLQYRRTIDAHNLFAAAIDAALETFWLARAAEAPTADELERHVREEAAFVEAIRARPP